MPSYADVRASSSKKTAYNALRRVVMKNVVTALSLCLLVGPLSALAAEKEPTVKGNYIETRSCDVYIGSCFANGEVGLMGHEAVLTWDVTEGSWQGVSLAGLKVLAVVKAKATLGDTSGNPYPARSVLIVDERANEEQKTALINLAKSMGGELLANVVSVQETAIEVFMAEVHSGNDCASVKAEGFVDIVARCFVSTDLRCNDRPFYPPLTDVEDPIPHATARDIYTGHGLGVRWDTAGQNSVYLASFSR